jgi:hypothetical protein
MNTKPTGKVETMMSHVIASGDGFEVRHYTYQEVRELFQLPSGPINVEELDSYLREKAYAATAGNCGQSAEDNGEGILIRTVW